MKTKGIRILDKVDRIVRVKLPDILVEVPEGAYYNWSILYFEAISDYKNGKTLPISEDEVNPTKNGLFISWDKLNEIASQFYQIYDMILIGCKDETALRRYENDQEMYETCDIVIVMFDSSYWEIFSKDERIILRLANKFNDIKLLESDLLDN